MWVYSLTGEHTTYFLKFIAHIRQGDSCGILLHLGECVKTLLGFCQRQDLFCTTLQYMSLACDLWGINRYTNQRWLLSLACFLCSLTWFCEVTIWWLSVCVCVCVCVCARACVRAWLHVCVRVHTSCIFKAINTHPCLLSVYYITMQPFTSRLAGQFLLF